VTNVPARDCPSTVRTLIFTNGRASCFSHSITGVHLFRGSQHDSITCSSSSTTHRKERRLLFKIVRFFSSLSRPLLVTIISCRTFAGLCWHNLSRFASRICKINDISAARRENNVTVSIPGRFYGLGKAFLHMLKVLTCTCILTECFPISQPSLHFSLIPLTISWLQNSRIYFERRAVWIVVYTHKNR
jgi:hypothetical protein